MDRLRFYLVLSRNKVTDKLNPSFTLSIFSNSPVPYFENFSTSGVISRLTSPIFFWLSSSTTIRYWLVFLVSSMLALKAREMFFYSKGVVSVSQGMNSLVSSSFCTPWLIPCYLYRWDTWRRLGVCSSRCSTWVEDKLARVLTIFRI